MKAKLYMADVATCAQPIISADGELLTTYGRRFECCQLYHDECDCNVCNPSAPAPSVCALPPQPPAPPPTETVAQTTDGSTVPTDGIFVLGEITTELGGMVYSFTAESGNTYQLDTELGTLDDTIMQLFATDGKTLVAETDDDERGGGKVFDSYIEWTCPASGASHGSGTAIFMRWCISH